LIIGTHSGGFFNKYIGMPAKTSLSTFGMSKPRSCSVLTIMPKISGTREWAVHNENCVIGCSHDCRYCYAAHNAARFHQRTRDDWNRMVVNWEKINAKKNFRQGRIMFPTSHDITPEVKEPCREFLIHMLESGNEVLLVSKPHLEVMAYLWKSDTIWKAMRSCKLVFRFSIGCHSDEIRQYWEPGAPSIAERIMCIHYIREHDGKVGVSSEPLLEPWGVDAMAAEILPIINDTLWLGPLNQIGQRVRCVTPQDYDEVAKLKEWQTESRVRVIYDRFKDNSQVRWKDGYKRLLGLPLAEIEGEDR